MKASKEELLILLREEPMGYVEICSRLGVTRREMRGLMEEVATDFDLIETIVNLQDGNGYFIPNLETPKGRHEAYKYLLQEKARARSINRRIAKLECMLRNFGIATETEEGKAYKEARQKAGMSMRTVTDNTGIDAPTLSKIENGRTSATEWQKIVLGKLYGCVL